MPVGTRGPLNSFGSHFPRNLSDGHLIVDGFGRKPPNPSAGPWTPGRLIGGLQRNPLTRRLRLDRSGRPPELEANHPRGRVLTSERRQKATFGGRPVPPRVARG